MRIPNPQSDDWFFWDPQTIHHYPADVVPADDEAPSDDTRLNDPERAHRLGNGWWRELLLSLISGVIAAVVLSIVVMLFPSSTRAASDFCVENTDCRTPLEIER